MNKPKRWWEMDNDFKYEPSKPFCFSNECNKGKPTIYTQRKVLKEVPFTIVFCPDCGEALVWGKFDYK